MDPKLGWSTCCCGPFIRASRIWFHSRDEVEFRDGIHGLLVWAIAVLIGAILAVAVSSAVGAGRAPEARSSNTSTAEPLFALELDQLFRSDRKPTDTGDPELRAQAARIISSGLGHPPWPQRIALTLFD
jgi:hypothetical protein